MLKRISIFSAVFAISIIINGGVLAGGTEIQDLSSQVAELQKLVGKMNRQMSDLISEREKDRKRIEELQFKLSEVQEGARPARTDYIVPRETKSELRRHLEDLEERVGAVKIAGSLNSVLQQTMGDGASDTNTWGGSADIFLEAKLAENTIAFMNLEAVSAAGADQNLGSVSGLNDDIKYPTNLSLVGGSQNIDVFNLLECWVEHAREVSPVAERFVGTLGKIDLTNYFDNNAVAGDENTQFTATAFVNNLAFAAPSNTPGVRVAFENFLPALFGKNVDLQIASASLDNSGFNIFSDPFNVVEIDIHPTWLKRPGNYRFYGYQSETQGGGDNHYDLFGYGINIDQEILDGLTVFGKWGHNQNKLVGPYGIDRSWSCGFQVEGIFKDRPEDIFGAAYGGVKLVDAKDGDDIRLRTENLVEIYYNYKVNDIIRVSPFVQVIDNAGGVDPGDSRAAILGLRTHADF